MGREHQAPEDAGRDGVYHRLSVGGGKSGGKMFCRPGGLAYTGIRFVDP